MRSFPSLLAALLVGLLALAPTAQASKHRTLKPVSGPVRAQVGIADQKAQFFTDPRFTALRLKVARRSVAWDTMQYDWQIADVDAWLQAARRAGVTPLITFARSRIDAKRHVVPTAGQIATAFRRFRARWPEVKQFVASNESNHYGEPTGRRPKLAAQYYRAMKKACPSCKIAAATLLDQPNLVRWAKAFVRAAREQPKYWALHDYVSANRFQTARTRQFLRAVKGQVWITEVGGLVQRRTPNAPGKARLPEGVGHAAKVTSFIFKRLVRVSPRITRVFLYHWNSDGPQSSWDSGLFDASGRPRPAFTTLRNFVQGRHAKQPLRKGRRR